MRTTSLTGRTRLLGAMLVLAFLNSAPGAAAGTDRIADLIRDKVAELRLPPTRSASATEMGRSTRAAIGRGDFKVASDLAGQVLASSQMQNWRFFPFEDFVAATPDVADPAFEDRLDEWVSKQDGDAIPVLLRAQYLLDKGRFVRGDRYARDVLPEHQRASTHLFERAIVDAQRAIELDPSNPYAHLLKLKTLLYAGDFGKLAATFGAAQRYHPTYYRLYDTTLAMLQPKWGGSLEAMRDFVGVYANQAPPGSPMLLLQVDLYRYLLDAAAVTCWSAPRENKGREDCIAAELRTSAPPEFQSRLIAGMDLFKSLDKDQFRMAIWEILNHVLSIGDAGSSSAAFLQVLATRLGSDTSLEGGGNGRSDYIVDLALAKSWYTSGFYDNAVKKSEQALSDLNATHSASDADRRDAASLVSQWLARTKHATKEFEEVLAHAEAAKRSGGSAAAGDYSCYAYIRLKDLRAAIQACSQGIEEKPADMAIHYWRGDTEERNGDIDGAISDLRTVAESENNLRSSAAIQLSMIYFNRGDLVSAKNVLERYRYLYDANLTSRATVAVAFNNLCYAKMELKSFEAAFADCNASLQFGNIPDAYKKQQELVRLKANGTW